jgi:hypothetical protein
MKWLPILLCLGGVAHAGSPEQNHARDLRITGSALLGSAALLLAGSLVLTVLAVETPSETCPQDELCVQDPYRPAEIGAAVVFGAAGVAAIVSGAVLLVRGDRLMRRFTPTASLGKSGGSIGVRADF